MHEEKYVVKECQRLLTVFLSLVGLELKASKTRIAHTLHKDLSEDNVAGFDFLGFNIRQFRTYYGSALENGIPLGFKTLIVPSKKSCSKHQSAIKVQIDNSRSLPQDALICNLNPIIQGWSRYFRVSDGQRTFSKQDFLTYVKLRRWAKRKTGSSSLGSTYWTKDGTRKWVFKPKDKSIKLSFHTNISCSVNTYVKVKGNPSPFNGDKIYWVLRLQKDPQLSTNTVKLLVKQSGKCSYCDRYFKDTDILEIDHINPKSKGGKEVYNNLRLLHRHCHDRITNENEIILKAEVSSFQ
jgi:RNA-directed DNA polymerase